MSKKAIKARQRAGNIGRRNLLAISQRDFARLLRDWGWAEDRATAAMGGHVKYRWHGHQVNFSRTGEGGSSMLPRVVAERASSIMGMSVVELLTGPTLDNPGVNKSLARAEQLDSGQINRWASLEDRLANTQPLAELSGEDVDIDLTADIDWDATDHIIPEDDLVDSTYPTTCPIEYCTHDLFDGTCAVHGRPLHLPDPDDPVTTYHLDAFLSAKFINLPPADRRIYLALQRRLVAEGLLTTDDTRPPTPAQVPHLTRARNTNGSTITSTTRKDPTSVSTMTDPNANLKQATKIKQARDAARRATAPQPGSANTIDEVLARTSGTIYPARRVILEALCSVGGRVHDDSGIATAKLNALIEKTGGKSYNSSAGLSSTMRAMEEDNQIARNTNGKRTYDIMVVDPLREELKTERYVEPATTPAMTPKPETVEVPREVVTLPEKTAEKVLEPPAPAVAPTPVAPLAAPSPPPPLPTVTAASTDTDLWALLDILLGDLHLTFKKETVDAFNDWTVATRALLDLAEN